MEVYATVALVLFFAGLALLVIGIDHAGRCARETSKEIRETNSLLRDAVHFIKNINERHGENSVVLSQIMMTLERIKWRV